MRRTFFTSQRMCEAAAMNRLADADSLYLRQHADNPVDWWPWCDEALAEARRRASASAASHQGHQSTGLSACWRRYRLSAWARRFIAQASHICSDAGMKRPGARAGPVRVGAGMV